MALSIPCAFALFYLRVGRVGNLTNLWKRNDSAISSHPIVFLDSIRRSKKSNNVRGSTMGLWGETKVGIQNTSVFTATGSDLDSCPNIGIGEDDILAVGECVHGSIVVLIDKGDDVRSRNGSFFSAHGESERTLAIDLLWRRRHLDDWDLINDLDCHRASDSWFGTGLPNTDKASMDRKWIASLRHGNNELPVSLAVISEVVESSEVRVSRNSSLGFKADSRDRSCLGHSELVPSNGFGSSWCAGPDQVTIVSTSRAFGAPIQDFAHGANITPVFVTDCLGLCECGCMEALIRCTIEGSQIRFVMVVAGSSPFPTRQRVWRTTAHFVLFIGFSDSKGIAFTSTAVDSTSTGNE
mmetsp:Transcript_7090/g.16567  ORF Transcript_7090/g.16567 Transcript_7090/m.16567 type:complete len:353 (-) Transcript_7090:2965-4023(-)